MNSEDYTKLLTPTLTETHWIAIVKLAIGWQCLQIGCNYKND